MLLGGVAAVSAILLISSLGGDEGTRQVESTTTTSDRPASSTVTTDPATTGPTEPADVEVTDEAVQMGATSRTYKVIAPLDVGADERLPLVVVLHGLGLDAQGMSRAADWRGAVAADRFVAVFPQGVSNSWNMGPCCPPANLLGVPDLAFLDRVFEQMTARSDIDAARLYLTGFSNGALTVYTFACTRPGLLAAIAPMAGTNITGCKPEQPLSLLHQHGDADLVVPYEGGLAIGSLVSSAPFPPVEDSVAAWAAADGCAAGPARSDEDGVERVEWSGCADGTEVQLVRIPGKGHEWLRLPSFEPLDELLSFFDIR